MYFVELENYCKFVKSIEQLEQLIMSFSISSKIIKLLRKDFSGGVKVTGRTFMPALCAAIAAIPAMAQSRNEFSLTVADAGNANIIVNRSFDGIMLPIEQRLNFDTDSTVLFPIANNELEHFFVVVDNSESNGRNSSFSFYTYGKSAIRLSPEESHPVNATGVGASQSDAVHAAEAPARLYWEYVTGSSSALCLRQDTVPASVEHKLINFADSLLRIINNVEEPVRTALRQEMALNTLNLWNEIYWGALNRIGSGISSHDEAENWRDVDGRMVKWAGLKNEYNAMSMIFRNVASNEWSKHLTEQHIDSLRTGGQQALLKARFDHYSKHYSGKNREYLLANLIYADTQDCHFTVGLDSLYSQFKVLYPHSAVGLLLDEAVAKNIAINSPSDADPDIKYIEVTEGETLDEILSRFEGKPLLVDVWASWCGPCRRSFQHADLIRNFAHERGIELLYISIDEREDRDNAVRKLVRAYNLKGNHLIMPMWLKQDIYSLFGNSEQVLNIPSVALFDSDGKMLQARFPESENAEALIKAIDKALTQTQ